MGLISNGTTLLDAGATSSGVFSGTMVLLSSQTLSNAATVSFTSGIDSTYKEYVFKFIDVHPVTDQKNLSFQVDTGTNTNYNQTITSAFYWAYHNEADTTATLEYYTGGDQNQGNAFQVITEATGNVADECSCGTLHLYDPASSTFLKHFMATTQTAEGSGHSTQSYVAGYINTTTAITRVQFKFNSGNIDSGIIKMYGIT
jgi:hypothetical protein